MALDPAELAARFRAIWTSTPAAANAAPDGASPQVSDPGPVERPWLTAESFLETIPRAVGEQGPPAPGSRTPPAAAPASAASEGPSSARHPRRRRWLPPASPAERRQEAVDPPPAGSYWCPFCGKRHQAVPMGGGGAAAAYSRPLLPEPGQGRRPTPLGREPGPTAALVRDSFRPWHRPPSRRRRAP
jgi:hypothetical protein